MAINWDGREAPKFRRLGAGDAPALAALEEACFSLPWSREQCHLALSQENFRAMGLWLGERLIAYVSFYIHPDEFEILNLASAPEERRKGFGDLIMRSLLQTAGNMGMQQVVLETRESNRPAIRLYKKHGFAQCGLRPGYYPDTKENALIMRRILGNRRPPEEEGS